MRSAFGLRQAVIETPDGIAAAGCDGWAGRCSVSAQPALLNRDRLDRNPVLAQWQGFGMGEASPCLRGDVNGAAVQNSDRLALGALITATWPLAGVHTALSRIPKP
jgi:hypothetical protein